MPSSRSWPRERGGGGRVAVLRDQERRLCGLGGPAQEGRAGTCAHQQSRLYPRVLLGRRALSLARVTGRYRPHALRLRRAALPAQSTDLGGGTPRWGLHSKRGVIDGDTTLLGTYNIDPRSANLNSELMVVCRGQRSSRPRCWRASPPARPRPSGSSSAARSCNARAFSASAAETAVALSAGDADRQPVRLPAVSGVSRLQNRISPDSLGSDPAAPDGQ